MPNVQSAFTTTFILLRIIVPGRYLHDFSRRQGNPSPFQPSTFVH